MKLTNSMLRQIARQIDSGYPIQAIATANHYLDKNCPLRLALAQKAKSKLLQPSPNLEKVLSGEIIERSALHEVMWQNSHLKMMPQRQRNIGVKITSLTLNALRPIQRRSPLRKNHCRLRPLLLNKNKWIGRDPNKSTVSTN